LLGIKGFDLVVAVVEKEKLYPANMKFTFE
jgi:hypothetical protein